MRAQTIRIGVLLWAVLAAGVGLGRHVAQPGTEAEGLLPAALTGATEDKGSDWPMFRHDPSHSAYTAEKLPPPLGLAWKYSTGQPIVSSPSVARGRVYFGSRDSTLHVLNAVTGKPVRKCKTRGWIDSSPALSTTSAYFTSRDGYVYCISPASGRLSWRHHTGGTDCSSPAVVDGVVYTASGFPNTHILALTARGGQAVWSYRTRQPVYSSPAVKDGIVYIGSNDGRFYALKHQETTQDTPIPPVRSRWSFETGGGVYFNYPAISDSLIYCAPGDYDKWVYCLRLSDGSVKWKYEVQNSKASRHGSGWRRLQGGRIEGAPSMLQDPDWVYPFVYVSSPALAQGTVYLVSGYPGQSLYALDALNGSLIWSQPIGRATGMGFSSSPVVADLVVYVGSGDGILHAFNALNGTGLWSYDMGSPILSSPAVAHKRLYVGTLGGDLCCFESVGGSLASLDDESAGTARVLPESYVLLPAIPNPFTTSATLTYAIPDAGTRGGGDLSTYQLINVSVYDLTGRLVKNLADEPKAPGYYTVTWDGADASGNRVPAGVYLLRLSSSEFRSTRKVTLLR